MKDLWLNITEQTYESERCKYSGNSGLQICGWISIGHVKKDLQTLQVLTGVTICYPHMVPDGWKIFGASSNQKPVLLAKEASSERQGRCWQHP